MTVNIPVEVLSERCLHCPDLEVDTFTNANFVVTAVNEDGTIMQKNEYDSKLRCAHLDSCKARYETVFKPEEKPGSARTKTKKATTRQKH